MRIAVDAIPLLHPNPTGIQNHARGICRALAGIGGHEYLLVYEQSIPAEEFDDGFVRSLGDAWRLAPARSPGPTPALARRIWEGWTLPRLLRRLGAGAYYSPTTRGPTGGRVPAFVTIHDLAKEITGVAPAPPPAVVRLARRSRGIFAVSDATARDVQRLLHVPADKITTVYNGPSLGIARRDADVCRRVCEDLKLTPGRFLLCVGDEHWRRRYDLLWQAMEGLWSAGRLEDVRLVFVGRQDWQQSRLAQLTGAAVRRDAAVFLRGVNDQILSALYSSALATILPTEAEGFGMPAVEAMVCDCPVLCSDIEVLREVAADAARYFPLGVEGISRAVLALVDDEAARAGLIARGRRQARRYTWEESARRVLERLTTVEQAETSG